MHPFITHINPALGKRISKIGLDKRFLRGEGCYLYDEKGREYLDFIAAYGALPFGYNHPQIWQAVHQLESSCEPSFSQPSLLEAAGELSEKLVEVTNGDFSYVTFANSGAEAVEASLKLARAKTGRLGIIATYNGFHGKTLGALSATGNPGYQKGFGAPTDHFTHVPFGDAQALEEVLREQAAQTAAFIVEPIQGEGGIVVPPRGYLSRVRSLCDQYGVILIFDEIQTGLGRTGSLFAYQDEQVVPDILLVAKALGGGLVPIGAALCKSEVYTDDFGLKHSSTFAGNSIGCRVGLRVLELLTADHQALVAEVARKGNILRQGLEEIQADYPAVLRQVRGRGLMLGLDFGSNRDLYPDSFLGIMAEQEILTPVIASFLLNTESLRVAPTLNGASVIRIEPPLIVTEKQIDQALRSLRRAVAMLAKRNTAAFIGHLIGERVRVEKEPEGQTKATITAQSSADHGRFAFLVHPVALRNYSQFDASLQVFDENQLAQLAGRWSDLIEPFVVSQTEVVSEDGRKAYGEFIGIPRTAEQLKAMPKEQAVAEITAAIRLAEERGAKIVGLGAYTSVVTMGGRSLLSEVDVPLTTGNSYTVASGVEALLTGAEMLGTDVHQSAVAVLGAGGAIGKASSLLLAEEAAEIFLIGNPARPEKSEYRMLKVCAEILRHLVVLKQQGRRFVAGTLADFVASRQDNPAPEASLTSWLEWARQLLEEGCPITVTVDAQKYIPQADLILAATSSVQTTITSEMLKWGALVCDMSRPTNVSAEVFEKRRDVLVIDGGLIEVPGRPSLGWDFGFEPGLAYACMSETMMLALARRYENTSIGADLNIETIEEMRQLAATQGFRLAGFRSFDRPISEERWQELIRVRAAGRQEAKLTS